jgi:hypothetical protein
LLNDRRISVAPVFQFLDAIFQKPPYEKAVARSRGEISE